MKGKFIVFEGIDGVGKTTMAKKLAKDLDGLYTYEPGDCSIGPFVRKSVLGKTLLTHEARCLLFAAERLVHLQEVVIPTLEAGEHVICDRYIGSAIAYGAFGGGLPREWIETLNEPALDLAKPDVTVYMTRPKVMDEFFDDGIGDYFESKGQSFMERVESGYLYQALNLANQWAVIPVLEGDIEGTYSQIYDLVTGLGL